MSASILLVGNFLSSRGVSRSVGEELAEHLKRAGHPIITTSRKRARLPRLLDMVFTVWSRRRAYQAAYVEAYSGPAFLWAEIVCRVLGFLKKPYVLALHGGNLPGFAGRSPGRVRRLLRVANAVIAPSRYLLDGMCSYRTDISLIPNPIELEQYPFRVRPRAAPRLIWLRAFHAVYNPRLAPRILAELCPSFPDITLTMVGPDKGDGTLPETRDLTGRLGLHAQVEILPGVPKTQVPRTLAQHDIFINTTNIDNTPVSVMEAMACGLCIVSTNVGGIPFLLEHEKDALLVAPNDPQAMAAAVSRILTEPGLAEKLSRNARSKAEEFDWAVVLPQWESLFQEILCVQ